MNNLLNRIGYVLNTDKSNVIKVKVISIHENKKCPKCGGAFGTIEVIEPSLVDKHNIVLVGTKVESCLNDIIFDKDKEVEKWRASKTKIKSESKNKLEFNESVKIKKGNKNIKNLDDLEIGGEYTMLEYIEDFYNKNSRAYKIYINDFEPSNKIKIFITNINNITTDAILYFNDEDNNFYLERTNDTLYLKRDILREFIIEENEL